MLEAKLQSLRTCRGQMPEDEDEAEDNFSRPRTKFRPRGQSGLEDLTSLLIGSLSMHDHRHARSSRQDDRAEDETTYLSVPVDLAVLPVPALR